MFEACSRNVRDMFGACLSKFEPWLNHIWSMFGPCLVHVEGLAGAAQRDAQRLKAKTPRMQSGLGRAKPRGDFVAQPVARIGEDNKTAPSI